jgi:hypothetical protein
MITNEQRAEIHNCELGLSHDDCVAIGLHLFEGYNKNPQDKYLKHLSQKFIQIAYDIRAEVEGHGTG